MKLTLELLKKIMACEKGISFAKRNNLIGFDLDRINEVRGDFDDFVSFLKNKIEEMKFSTYDSMGNELTFKDSDGGSYEKTYDSNGNVLTFKDSDGDSWKKTYDSMGNELTRKDSNGFSTERTYDSNGNELTYKNSDGYSTERTYDSNGNELTCKDSYGDSTEYSYEYLGNKLHKIISNGKVLLEIPAF